jgi:NAD(P) transhydrogenase subunit beta
MQPEVALSDSTTNMLTVAYLAAAVLFIRSLGGLATQQTARRGNLYGIVGMAIAVVATAFDPRIDGYAVLIAAVAVGGGVGAWLAGRVAMTSMPQLVAMLHSFVGLAAVLVGISSYLAPGEGARGVGPVAHAIEIYADVALGAITLTGSVVAWAKLEGRISGKPLLLPGRHFVNAGLALAMLVMGVIFAGAGGEGIAWLLFMTLVAGFLGIHLVAAIGGADMPVVVSLLNSYSGWTASAAGFMLGNDLLIVTGALVGSSGAILSYIMCRAMNRSIWNVAFGGFGTEGGAAGGAKLEGEVRPIHADEVAQQLRDGKEVVVVPGYGMAVAQAQHLVNELGALLRQRGVRVRYAIHPVAGRLPGHMNVLLAEAGVPYDIVLEMDEINEDFPKTDVVMVIGANDIVNPSAQDDRGSPIYGMPVLEVWKSKTVVVLKRGMATGYAGVENPLFLKENTRMLFGDAKDSMGRLVAALRTMG